MTRISNFCPPFPSGSRSRLRCIVVLHGIRGVSSKTHCADLRRFLRKARIYWALSKCHSGQTITFHFIALWVYRCSLTLYSRRNQPQPARPLASRARSREGPLSVGVPYRSVSHRQAISQLATLNSMNKDKLKLGPDFVFRILVPRRMILVRPASAQFKTPSTSRARCWWRLMTTTKACRDPRRSPQPPDRLQLEEGGKSLGGDASN